ncbi:MULTISPECIES: MBL fold metallo-hydrolase [Herbaspirillum]|nr:MULTISPECIES: MBL fold metallo-hydrolase [Herbaspirillum]MCP3658719.1 MBL fold metallo-hydrolase [Herbaspirillum sp.]MCP3948843.1 MBL fold metallo-hydrolase [Herbaspirillum sp.]MCP4030210.1 MBL fold metallo-hydrolase [Herbaspirillum sp.]MCP4555514.1 MBL fold metallo-hydrolase [Herbaspirillum sp.]MEE1636817.1 MBL fold metallo-hydrolase [Herbaspirillum huttiense NC40101]
MNTSALRLPPSLHVLERGWLSSNNVLLFGRDEVAMIDSGYVAHAEQTQTLVRHVLHQRGRERLDVLLNTHLHSDHCGGNAALHAAYGCRIAIPAAEDAKVRQWDEDALSYRATGQRCPRFVHEQLIRSGDVLSLGDLDWTALAAPGHDPHALLLYCAQEGVLISADALWRNGFGIIFPELDGESGFEEARATLELIRSLDVRTVIPGHGAPFTEVDDALDKAFSRLDYLQADPLRNAHNGIKVLVKFLLLERGRIALADLPAMMREIPLLRITNARFLQMEDAALADWCVAQLQKAGAAASDGVFLLDR